MYFKLTTIPYSLHELIQPAHANQQELQCGSRKPLMVSATSTVCEQQRKTVGCQEDISV